MNSVEASCQDNHGARPAHRGMIGEHADRLAEIAGMARTGIDAKSGLASDFLNQFNEVSMLLDMACDDSDLLEELADWQPRNYADHFASSNFSDTALVLEAFSLCPADLRAQFEQLSAELGGVIMNGLESILDLGGDNRAAAERCHELAADVRARIGTLSAIIHPTERSLSDADISAMFARRR